MNAFLFQQPAMLLLLGAAPVFHWLLVWAKSRRAKAFEALGASKTTMSPDRSWVWTIVFILLTLALARPGYDPVRYSTSQQGRDVVFVLDISRSMLAEDAYPSRLEAAKQGILDCLAAFDNQQAALVIYAGSASIACPLTSDYDFVRYMLSQVQPRSVEFGGTMLLSAMEKVVDQVLSDERQSFQDLIVLTDGEDFGPDMQRVAALVNESRAALLLVGLGDSVSGARIPVLNEKGEAEPLRHQGEIIYTRLQSQPLQDLAKLNPESEYFEAGTHPFHLGDVYTSFASGKGVASSGSDSVIIVYREAAFFIMPLAFALVLFGLGGFARFRQKTVAVLACLFFLQATETPLAAQEVEKVYTFDQAAALVEQSQYEEASSAFAQLRAGAESAQTIDTSTVAALSFNLGLSQQLQAAALSEASPTRALEWARAARSSLLKSARTDPGLRRSRVRLDTIAGMIQTLEAAVEKEKQEREQQESLIDALIKQLQALQAAQISLRSRVADSDIDRSKKRPANEAPEIPTDADRLSQEFKSVQAELLAEGERIRELMTVLRIELSRTVTAQMGTESQNAETVMDRPLELMKEVIEAQDAARGFLPEWQDWGKAQISQKRAIDKIQEILDLFASDDGEEGDEPYEDWEEYMESADGEGTPSSIAMDGDFRMDALMQPLPVPNFSIQEILMEESSNQQFRQEKRSKANAGKVEKDW